MEQQTQDTILLKVLSKYYERSQLGIKKYGRTLDRDDLSLIDWLNHLQEELMDATLYIEKLKDEARNTERNIPKNGTNCEDELYHCILENGCDGLTCYNCIKKHETFKSE